MYGQNISTLNIEHQALQDMKTQRQVENRRRRNNNHTVEGITNLKKLAKAINGREYIPYEKLLSSKGFMTDSMSVRISRRKRELDAELANVKDISTKFDIDF